MSLLSAFAAAAAAADAANAADAAAVAAAAFAYSSALPASMRLSSITSRRRFTGKMETIPQSALRVSPERWKQFLRKCVQLSAENPKEMRPVMWGIVSTGFGDHGFYMKNPQDVSKTNNCISPWKRSHRAPYTIPPTAGHIS